MVLPALGTDGCAAGCKLPPRCGDGGIVQTDFDGECDEGPNNQTVPTTAHDGAVLWMGKIDGVSR